MTYRYYIAKNNKADCMETWKEFLEKYNYVFKVMNPEMKEQHARATFRTRFVIQYK